MNDEKFQDIQHKARMSGEKFEKAIMEVLEKYGVLPSYKRTEDQSANLVAEIYQFLLAFPSQRLGTVMATIVPEDRLFMFQVYDEEIIRRLRLYREFLNKVDNDIDWVGYLENHSEK